MIEVMGALIQKGMTRWEQLSPSERTTGGIIVVGRATAEVVLCAEVVMYSTPKAGPRESALATCIGAADEPVESGDQAAVGMCIRESKQRMTKSWTLQSIIDERRGCP